MILMRDRLGLLFLVAVGACGGAAKPAEPPPPPPRTATGDVNVRNLVLEMAEKKACAQLEGKWIGLPAQDDAPQGARPNGFDCRQHLEGADAGLGCAWGRLQIRDCKSAITPGSSIGLSFGGIGWTWVDRKSGDVAVRQYVYMSASVEMQGALDVGFDPNAHVASIWLTPTQPLKAKVTALGIIKLQADSALGQLEKLAAGALGVDPKHQVAVQGAAQFEDTLRKGMTITFDTQTQQVDLMLGALPNGVVPKRPLPVADRPWILDERQEVFPGGVLFAGPFDPMPAVKLDAKGEGGAPLAYGVACASDATLAADSLARGDKPALTLQSRGQISGESPSKVILPPACPWVLVTSSAGAESARAALEITPTDPPSTVAGALPVVPTLTSATVWVTVQSYDFETRKPDGKSWDFGGGAPDPTIWLRAGNGTKLTIVPMQKDSFRSNPMLKAPAAVEVTATSPLVIGATDVDEVSDDPMGEATVTLDDIVTRGRDLEVEVKLGGARTGRIRLRVER